MTYEEYFRYLFERLWMYRWIVGLREIHVL